MIGCGNIPKAITNTAKLAKTENSALDKSPTESSNLLSPTLNMVLPYILNKYAAQSMIVIPDSIAAKTLKSKIAFSKINSPMKPLVKGTAIAPNKMIINKTANFGATLAKPPMCLMSLVLNLLYKISAQ